MATVDDQRLAGLGEGARADRWRATRRPVKVATELVRRRRRGVGQMPGPIGRPVVGVAPQLMRDPFGYTYECAQRYGDYYRLPLPGWDVVMFNHPDDVPPVFNSRDGVWCLASDFARTTSRLALGGVAMGALDGAPHMQRRKTINPMFSTRSLAGVADVMVDEFDNQLKKWDRWADNGQEFDLQEAIAGITAPAFLRAMFSSAITQEQEDRLNNDSRILMKLISAAFLLRLPPNPYRLARASRSFIALTRELVDARLTKPDHTEDLLSAVVNQHRESPDDYPYDDLVADTLMLIGGGYETVVAALSWTYALLLTSPEARARLDDEVANLGGARPHIDDLKRMPWGRACFDEGQRLQGHPFQPHIAQADTELGGYPIPKGTMAAMSFYALHRDERWWDDPHRYDPTRFVDEAVINARPRNVFLPFSHGQHHCPGFSMAYMNGQFLLAMITQRYHMTLRPGWKPVHDTTWSTTVKGGVPVTITRR